MEVAGEHLEDWREQAVARGWPDRSIEDLAAWVEQGDKILRVCESVVVMREPFGALQTLSRNSWTPATGEDQARALNAARDGFLEFVPPPARAGLKSCAELRRIAGRPASEVDLILAGMPAACATPDGGRSPVEEYGNYSHPADAQAAIPGWPPQSLEAWVDGSGTTADKHAAIGVVLVDPACGRVLAEASSEIGLGTNNYAEVLACGRALSLAYGLVKTRAVPLRIYSDSEFAIGAVRRGSTFNVRASKELARLVQRVRGEVVRWSALDFQHVKGHSGIVHNERADLLAGRARKAAVLASQGGPPDLLWVDVETSGVNPAIHALLEVALVRTNHDASRVIDRLEVQIIPHEGAVLDGRALRVNGIEPRSASWSSQAIPLVEALTQISAKIPGRYVLAGHGVHFDQRFLEASFKRANLPSPPAAHAVLDTQKLARKLSKSLGPKMPASVALESLCSHFGISNEGAHRAAGDVRRNIEVYQRLRVLEGELQSGLLSIESTMPSLFDSSPRPATPEINAR